MTAENKQLLSARNISLPRLEWEMSTKGGFHPQGNSSTCVVEIRYETLGKILKACVSTTIACTHCFSNLPICISISVNRSDSACSLVLICFIFSGSLSLRQCTLELGTHIHINELAGWVGDDGCIQWDLLCATSENKVKTVTQR